MWRLLPQFVWTPSTWNVKVLCSLSSTVLVLRARRSGSVSPSAPKLPQDTCTWNPLKRIMYNLTLKGIKLLHVSFIMLVVDERHVCVQYYTHIPVYCQRYDSSDKMLSDKRNIRRKTTSTIENIPMFVGY